MFKRFMPAGFSAAAQPERPTEDREDQAAFLVATSAGEVGVDLDADHIVCDLVPWERMVQRLGRVNRRPEPGKALIDVFCLLPPKEAEDKADAARLAKWRAPFEHADWPADAEGRRDASPGMLHALKDKTGLRPLLQEASTDEPLHPELTAALIDAWAMTSLPVHPGRPDIQPWLRGWVASEPQSRVVWRRLLPVRPDDDEKVARKTLGEFFQHAPTRTVETLETETSDVAAVLQKRAKAVLSKAASKPEDGEPAPPPYGAVTLNRRGEIEQMLPLRTLADLPVAQLYARLADRTVVVTAELAGLEATGLLDDKADLSPRTLDGTDEAAFRGEDDPLHIAGFRVRRVGADDPADPEWPIEWRWRLRRGDESDDGEEIRVEIWRRAGATAGDAAIAKTAQTLREHHEWTKRKAETIADRLGLSEAYRAMLGLAAAAHDAGKARELWQRAMRAKRDEGSPYAKTTGGGNPNLLDIAGQIYRHEFGSLRDAGGDPDILRLPEELRELALHLIASHHGFARPVIAAVDPEHAPSASAELAREAALRYARLQAQWGAWGLAWWEALLRAADWAASRELNEHPETP